MGNGLSSYNEPRMNALEQKVLETYRSKSYRCTMCQDYCNRKRLELHGPLSYFNIGDEYEDDEYRIAFVGKTTWYDKSDVNELSRYPGSIFRDCRNHCKSMFENHPSKFWVYIRRIAQQLYEEEKDNTNRLLSHIVITNLTKCNTSEGSDDTTPYFLTDKCAEIFEEEIRILQPKHIILLTGRGYDPYTAKLKFGYRNPPKNVNGQMGRHKIGNIDACWWEREFSEDSRETMAFLRTRHPVRAPSQFVEEIVKWIKSSDSIP